MISWIQNHLIRHGRWIFLTLLAVIIVAFVFTIGNTPGCTTNQSNYEANLFYGYDLNSPLERKTLDEKISLSSILRTGRPIQSQQQFQSELARRITLLHLADLLGTPEPTEKTFAQYIQSRAAFRGPDGQFSNDAYTRFLDNIESNPSIQENLVFTVLQEDYRIEEVESVLSGPGYFLPSEALSQVQLNETQIALTTAEIDYTTFKPDVEPAGDTLEQFYLENSKRYEIKERIQAGYIAFDTEKYSDSIKDLTESELREHFITNRARFVADHEAKQPKPETGEALDDSKPKTVTFEDVRDEVSADLRLKTAKKLANQAAQNFALTLYRNKIEKNTPAFEELLNASDLKLVEIPPYTEDETSGNELPANMLKSAFELTGTRYFSDAYEIDDGFGILITSGRLPAEIPAYEIVAESVLADYVAEEKRRLFNEEGQQLYDELSEFLDSGIEFVQAAETLGLSATSDEAFKISEAPRTIDRAVLQKAQNMQASELSPMITIGDKGIFIYIDERIVPEIDPADKQLEQTSNFLQRYSSFISSNALLNELVANGTDEAETDLAP